MEDAVRHVPLRTWDQEIGERIPWIRDTLMSIRSDDFWAAWDDRPTSLHAHRT